MKTYLLTTGVVFALVTVAHVVRMVAEPHVLSEPFFHLLTLLSAGLAVWAWRLFRVVQQ